MTASWLTVAARMAGLFWLSLLLLLAPGAASAQHVAVTLEKAQTVNLNQHAQLFRDRGEGFPATEADIADWQAALQPATAIRLLGGSYWLAVQLRNTSREVSWVFDPNDTLIAFVEARVYGSDGSIQQIDTGYYAKHDYMLHYGKGLTLARGIDYRLLIKLSSPYFARQPVMALAPEETYQHLVASENFQILASLGALIALGMFNFFIFSFTRDRSFLYYSLYVLTYAVAWAITFHLAADLFDWHGLHWHYVPFFLLPVFSTLFYVQFLRLKQRFPRLAKASRINLMLPLLLLPSCWLAPAWAHTLATIVISIWMTLALVSGIVAWRNGIKAARFFVLAFIALMLPGLVILPANLGLIPALVDNAQLLTLLGGTLDGLLLAFALADQIRLLRNNLEQRVAERTAELTQANAALTAAKEHAEIVSRHRIEFLSAMSHDIRTPLAGVLGMLKFALRDKSVHGRTEEYLRIGLHNGQSLLAILNDILDYSKIDAGKLTLESVPFRLTDLVADAIGILQGHADAKSLLLRRELGEHLPEYVNGDPTRIRQIIINLLGNAIKFTDRGEVRLSVQVESCGARHATLLFAVTDTGPGIAPEVRQRLFQKFEQADHSTTRRYGGTGLGLAICRELVSLMGGAIWVQSEVGAGACFSFRLPLEIGDAPAGAQPEPVRERHQYQLRILCAEDVRTNQIIISTLLDHMGHQVSMVENGLAAIAALAEQDYDLVLMDGRMPLMDGEQATRLIRKGGFEDKVVRDRGIHIIALTANASELDSARYLAAGMNGFLSKPLDEHLLYDQLQTTIDQLLAAGRTLPPSSTAAEREQALSDQFGVAPATTAPRAAGSAIRIVPLPGLSQQHMDKIAQAFIDEAPRRVLLAREALGARDADAATAAFHAIKGSAGYLSSQRLHQLAHRLEQLASSGQLDAIEAQFGQLVEAVDQAIGDLQASTVLPAPTLVQ